MSKKRIVLGIESSCDETSVSLVREKSEFEQEILSNIVNSQIKIHAKRNGGKIQASKRIVRSSRPPEKPGQRNNGANQQVHPWYRFFTIQQGLHRPLPSPMPLLTTYDPAFNEDP